MFDKNEKKMLEKMLNAAGAKLLAVSYCGDGHDLAEIVEVVAGGVKLPNSTVVKVATYSRCMPTAGLRALRRFPDDGIYVWVDDKKVCLSLDEALEFQKNNQLILH